MRRKAKDGETWKPADLPRGRRLRTGVDRGYAKVTQPDREKRVRERTLSLGSARTLLYVAPCGAVSLLPGAAVSPAASHRIESRPHAGPACMMLEREAVDALAREILDLIQRLRPLLEGPPNTWPASRGRAATALSRDLGGAVQAHDVAVEALYFQTDSLEPAHMALEVERRAYQELFEAGPDGLLVSDPDGVIVRANARAGEVFGCAADDLVGHGLPVLVEPQNRTSLEAAIAGFEVADWDAEWIGEALRAQGPPFRVALTAAVVRHSD